MLWENVSTVVPGFTGETIVELPVPCSFDMTIAATRYFDALESGDVALSFLFSGTVFHEDQEGNGRRAASPFRGIEKRSFGCRSRPGRDCSLDIIRTRPGSLCGRKYSIAFNSSSAARDRPVGRKHWKRCSRVKRRCRHESLDGRSHRERRALRGVHPLPLSSVREEPPSLDLRRAVSRGLLSSDGGVRAIDQPDRVPAAGVLDTTIEVVVRFLHLTARQIGQFDPPLAASDAKETIPFRPVEMLRVGKRIFHSWQEAEEREVAVTAMKAGALERHPNRLGFSFPGRQWRESIIEADDGNLAGVIAREQHEIRGEVGSLVLPRRLRTIYSVSA